MRPRARAPSRGVLPPPEEVVEDRLPLRFRQRPETLGLREVVHHAENRGVDRLLEHERGIDAVVGGRQEEVLPKPAEDRDRKEVGVPLLLALRHEDPEAEKGSEENPVKEETPTYREEEATADPDHEERHDGRENGRGPH